MIRTRLMLRGSAAALAVTLAAPAVAAAAIAVVAMIPQAALAQNQAADQTDEAERGEIVVDGTRPIAES
jgi:hypothetical protein